MFSLTHSPIETTQLRDTLQNPKAGGIVIFEGRVRDHNEGQAVSTLYYEAYESMALKIGTQILEEAQQKYALCHVRCEHRLGTLTLEELAVWVGVSSAHRKEAFEACAWIIDRIKTELPIWKQETYHSGETHWVNCQRCEHSRC